MPIDSIFPDPAQPTEEEARRHPDMAQLFSRRDQALEDRDHWRTEARREHTLVEHTDAALRQCRSELAEALLLAEKLQRERDEARDWARRLLWERDAARAIFDNEEPPPDTDSLGVCHNCGGPMRLVQTGRLQCPDCGISRECKRTTYKGKCPNGCDLPKDYSEEP